MNGWETIWNKSSLQNSYYVHETSFNSHGAKEFLPLHAASQFAPCSRRHRCKSHLVSPQPASWWLWGQSWGAEGCESGTCYDPHCNMSATDLILPIILYTDIFGWMSKSRKSFLFFLLVLQIKILSFTIALHLRFYHYPHLNKHHTFWSLAM